MDAKNQLRRYFWESNLAEWCKEWIELRNKCDKLKIRNYEKVKEIEKLKKENYEL